MKHEPFLLMFKDKTLTLQDLLRNQTRRDGQYKVLHLSGEEIMRVTQLEIGQTCIINLDEKVTRIAPTKPLRNDEFLRRAYNAVNALALLKEEWDDTDSLVEPNTELYCQQYPKHLPSLDDITEGLRVWMNYQTDLWQDF